jgi:protein involved in polysaccharide export with SLBB domain
MVALKWLRVSILICGILGYLGLHEQARSANGTAAYQPGVNAIYKLGTGDKVRVTVFNEPDLSGEFEVNDQGQIALPLIGNVQIGGKSLSESEALITEKYGESYLVNPRVSLQVLNYRPFFILGEVQHPGSYPYVVGMTILNAVALAGGYTPRADKSDIVLKHGANQSSNETKVGEDAMILPGDVIRVNERFF